MGTNFLIKTIRKIKATPSEKEGVPFVEELWILRFKYQEIKYCWNLILEKYEKFQIVLITFYLCKNAESKGFKKFNRNFGNDCINPLITLQLFKECFYLCTKNESFKNFSFGFYALDDNNLDLAKEDMNKRMSAYINFLNRKQIIENYNLKNMGNLNHNLYVGFNPIFTTEIQIEEFIEYYIPVMEKELQALKNEHNQSQKL